VLDRQYTVMVVPDARGSMRRFHVKGRHLAVALGALGLVAVLALTAPIFLGWGMSVSGELSEVREERDRLADRSAAVEETLSDLRARLDRFEQRTKKLAFLAGLDMPELATGAQGFPAGVEELSAIDRAAVFRSEADELSGLGELLERRLDTVERAFGEQTERLSRIPSIIPVRGLIGSGFGWRRDPFTGLRQYHRGLDVSAPEGTPIRAPADGVVLKTERNGGYGRVLYLSHGDGIVTRFGHLLEYKARPGSRVKRGDVIALLGNSGRSTAPHLHYEVVVDGKHVDPMNFVSEEGLFY
jgi:murein DD-endopeptidase MepM/ murein hydrolase activator NlpD